MSVLLRLARRISQIQTWLILSVLYVLVVAPMAVLFRLAVDPLRLRRAARVRWHPKSQPSDRWAWAKAQF